MNEDGGCPAAENQVSNAVSTLLHFVLKKHAHYNAEPTGMHTVQTLSPEDIIQSQREVFLSKGFQGWLHKKKKKKTG